MDQPTHNVLQVTEIMSWAINGGIGAVLLFLYIRLEQRHEALIEELRQVRAEQWGLIVSIVGEERASIIAHESQALPGFLPKKPK